jgi:hypothetical protein
MAAEVLEVERPQQLGDLGVKPDLTAPTRLTKRPPSSEITRDRYRKLGCGGLDSRPPIIGTYSVDE